jgi:hypothetical protein
LECAQDGGARRARTDDGNSLFHDPSLQLIASLAPRGLAFLSAGRIKPAEKTTEAAPAWQHGSRPKLCNLRPIKVQYQLSCYRAKYRFSNPEQ